MTFKSLLTLCWALVIVLGVSGCATEEMRSVPISPLAVSGPLVRPDGKRTAIAVSQVDNRSSFMRGIFFNGVDRLGGQAKTILITHLQQTPHFDVMDRDNLSATKQEADFKHTPQAIRGADYVLTGDISEFGRKEVGDHQLFGLLGRGKIQIAYAKVSVNVVDVRTSEVVYSTQGAGEYSLSNREVLGFGGTASYDSTLNGKVLDLAIREVVRNLVSAIDSGAWRPLKK